MNAIKFYDRIFIFEKIGLYIGTVLGKIIKKPIKLIIIVIPFMFVAFISFIYSIKEGFKKS